MLEFGQLRYFNQGVYGFWGFKTKANFLR